MSNLKKNLRVTRIIHDHNQLAGSTITYWQALTLHFAPTDPWKLGIIHKYSNNWFPHQEAEGLQYLTCLVWTLSFSLATHKVVCSCFLKYRFTKTYWTRFPDGLTSERSAPSEVPAAICTRYLQKFARPSFRSAHLHTKCSCKLWACDAKAIRSVFSEHAADTCICKAIKYLEISSGEICHLTSLSPFADKGVRWQHLWADQRGEVYVIWGAGGPYPPLACSCYLYRHPAFYGHNLKEGNWDISSHSRM